MDFSTARILVDFGLLILIWMIQLTVYPSFSYFKGEELLPWHSTYTKRITALVAPLMIGQLVIYGILLVDIGSFFAVAGISLVLILWIITFTIFVPLHNSIHNNEHTSKILEKLTRLNWIRTTLWTLLFLWSLKDYLSHQPI